MLCVQQKSLVYATATSAKFTSYEAPEIWAFSTPYHDPSSPSQSPTVLRRYTYIARVCRVIFFFNFFFRTRTCDCVTLRVSCQRQMYTKSRADTTLVSVLRRFESKYRRVRREITPNTFERTDELLYVKNRARRFFFLQVALFVRQTAFSTIPEEFAMARSSENQYWLYEN